MELKPILPKETIYSLDYIKFMLLASASSSRFGVINLYENNKIFKSRGNLNALMIAPFGTGKTSQICSINNVKIETARSVSMPGLIGTITRDGQYLIGSCFNAGGKLLLIDECQSLPHLVKDAMNQLLEPPHEFRRDIGFKSVMPVHKKTRYAWVRGEENWFKIRSKFSCIASGMRINLENDVDKAWYSRFIPMRLKVDLDYIEKLVGGETIFEVNALDFAGDFEFKDYMKFRTYYFKKFRESRWMKIFNLKQDDYGFIARNTQDLARLAAFSAALDGTNEIELDHAIKMTDKWFHQILYNILIGPLSDNEYKTIGLVDSMSQDEIAAILGISQGEVSKIIDFLKAKGIITEKDKPTIDKEDKTVTKLSYDNTEDPTKKTKIEVS